MSKRKSSQSHLSRSNMNTFWVSRSSGNSSDLITFYQGTGHDYRGRSLSDILRWSASKLESSHDYIQTVFPLPESSGVNWNAPTIDRRVFDAFRSRPELRSKLRESFQKILWFYGFTLNFENGVTKVVNGDNYDKNSENWDSRFDHNHLRITRIIRCLRVLGLEDEALAFRSALEENTKYVSPRSREYWRRAAQRGLNIRPDLEVDDEDDDSFGPKFLCEFEQERKKKVAEAKKDAKVIQETAEKAPEDKNKATDANQAESETISADDNLDGIKKEKVVEQKTSDEQEQTKKAALHEAEESGATEARAHIDEIAKAG